MSERFWEDIETGYIYDNENNGIIDFDPVKTLNKQSDEIIELKQQLTEKEKQIKELSEEHFEMFGDMKNYKNLWLAEQRKVEELENKLEHCSNDKWYIDLDKLNIPSEIAIKLRKQVCEEIKEKVNKCAFWECEYDCQMIEKDEFDKIIDQVEKGE